MKIMETDIAIVGAGPVGLTLAIDLARRGLDVTVLELRHRGEPPSVKCNHVSARSMELFRLLGICEKIRNTGLPEDYPHDIAFRTTMTGLELTRIRIPSRAERYSDTQGADSWWPTPEPPHRINQMYLEPILFEHAAATPGVQILNRVNVKSFSQDADMVRVEGEQLDSGERICVTARYLVGCDGARSIVRRQMGATLHGDAVVQRVQSSYIRAPELLGLIDGQPAWGNMSLNPRRSGTVYAIDGRETWLVHNYLRPDEADFDSVDRDKSIRTILGVDDSFEYEIISREDWFGRRLLADRFRNERVFICGDSAHLWVPYAGYGMNAGLADAANLAWLLAAHLNGWGGPSILDAYERERLPITEQVSYFAMDHAHATARQRRAVPVEIEDDSPAGEAARADLGQATYDLNVQQYACAGLNFGYYYDDSPIIAYDGEPHPPYTMGSFTPSTVPGCRVPHFRLHDGRSLFDAMGTDYTLLRFDPDVPAEPILHAARQRNVPLQILDIQPAPDSDIYTTALLIARPDQHIAWRGDHAPPDPLALIDLIRGAAG